MTTAMTTNEYRGLFLKHNEIYYYIESNTTTTITLQTPGSAYTDLSSESVQIISNYATLRQVEQRTHVNVDTAETLLKSDELGEALFELDQEINFELDLEDVETNTTYLNGILRKIEIDRVIMGIRESSRLKKTNPGEEAQTYWQLTPDFTNRHLRTLRKVKEKIKREENGTVQVYNKRTGRKIPGGWLP